MTHLKLNPPYLMKLFVVLSLVLFVSVAGFSQDESIDKPSESSVLSLESTNLGFLENSVNLFTGDLVMPLNLVSMNAPGGIPVNVSLVYNSNSERMAHHWVREEASGEVGYGWSFSYPSIVVDNKNTGTRVDDEFYLKEGSPNKLICTNLSVSYYVADKGISYTAKTYKTKEYSPYTFYYIELLERWEVWREGYKYVFGCWDLNPTAVQWIVNWGNWIGSSSTVTGMEPQAVEWNLAKVENQWGKYVKYEYQNRDQAVSQTSGSLENTESSLLKTISQPGSFRIELIYSPKAASEYYDPHTAYSHQDRYIKDYLSSVEIYNEFDQKQKTVYLYYTTTGDTHPKRLLNQVKSQNDANRWTDPISFYYEDYTQVNQEYVRKLSRVVSPTGSETTFTYSNQTIGNLSMAISPPSASYSQKKVWSHQDYTVVALRNPSDGDTRFYTYWWNGRWEYVLLFNFTINGSDVEFKTTNGRTLINFKNLQIRLEEDHFALSYRKVANDYYLGRAYINSENKWDGELHEHNVGSGTPTLVVGNDFSGLAEWSDKDIHVYYRTNPTTWTSTTLSMPTGGTSYYAAGNNNFIFSQAYVTGTGNYDLLQLTYLDQTYQWNTVSVPTAYSMINDVDPSSILTADNSFVYIHQTGNTKGYIYKWTKNYSFDSSSKLEVTGLTGTYMDVQFMFNSLLEVVTNTGPSYQTALALRYNPEGWTSTSPVNISHIEKLIGRDFIALHDVLQYNPSTNAWSIVSDRAKRTFGEGLIKEVLYYSNDVPPNTTPVDECFYIRNDGQHIMMSKATPFNSVRSPSPGGAFLFAHDGSVIKFFVRKSGVLRDRTLPVSYIITGDEWERSFYGPTSFVTYATDNSLTIHKVVAGEYDNGTVTDRAVTAVTVDDGYRDLTTSFSYTGTNQRYDAFGNANYEEVRVTPGTGIGYTVHKFFNGTSTSGANFGNEATYYRVLKGQKYQSITYSQAGTEVARDETGFNVSESNGHVISRVNKTRSVIDNVERITEFTYNSKHQLNTSTFRNYDSNGNEDVIVNLQTFNWEGSIYDFSAKGIYSAVIQSEKRVNTSTKSLNTTRWKDWGSGKWAPESSFTWNGGTTAFTPYFNSTTTPTGWIKTGTLTARDSYGNASESLDMNGMYSSTLYGFSGAVPLMSAYNAQASKLFYDDFSGAVSNSWTFSTNASVSNDKLVFGTGAGRYAYHSMALGTVPSNVDFKIRFPDAATSGWAGYVFNKTGGSGAWSASGNIALQIKANSASQFQISVYQGGTQLSTGTYAGKVTDWHTVSIKYYTDPGIPFIDIYLDGNEILTQVEIGSVLIGVNSRAFHSESRQAEFDHYRVYPANSLASSLSLDKQKKQLTETMDADGLLMTNMYDTWGSPVATLDTDGLPVQTVAGATSPKFNTVFNVNDPGRALATVASGATGFSDDFSYQKAWAVQNATANSTWQVQNGLLTNTITGTFSGNNGYFIDLGAELSGRVSIEFDLWSTTNTYPITFGFMAGGNTWDYTSSGTELGAWMEVRNYGFYFRNSGAWANPLISATAYTSKAVRIKVVVDTDGTVAYYVDGKQYGSYGQVASATGIQKLGFYVATSTSGTYNWYVDNVVAYTDGIESQTFYDALGKPIQSSARGTTNAEIYTTETIFDALGRGLGQTKATKLSTGILAYQPNFVQSFSETTGAITGDVYTLNGNDSYAYSSVLFDTTPLSRTLKAGSPGSTFSAYSTHPGQYGYSGNSTTTSSDYYMGTGYTVANRYSATKVTDQDGNESVSFHDKAGNQVMTHTQDVQVTYNDLQSEPLTINLSSSATTGIFTATHNHTVSWGVSGVLKIGTSGYGSSNIVNHTSGTGGGNFTATQGVTYYITYSGSYGGSVSYTNNYTERNTRLTTKFEYDDAGNLIKIYPPNYFDNPGTAADDSFVTTMTYDVLGRVTQKTSPDEGTVKYLYDDLGRIRFSQDARGASEGFVKYWLYDLFGRVTEEGYWTRSWTGLTATTTVPVLATWRIKYAYEYSYMNRPGQLISISTNNDDNTNIETAEFYEYDRYSRVTTVTLYTYGYDNSANIVAYEYDRMGNVTREDYSGLVVTYNRYTTNGSLKSIGTATNANRFSSYTYDVNGRLWQEKLDDNAITRAYTYDSRGMLAKIDDAWMTEDLYYTSNGYGGAAYYNGRIASTAFTFKSGGWTGATRPADYSYSFGYDAAARLRVADHSTTASFDLGVGVNNQVRYDANGNYMKIIENTTTREYEYTTGTNKVKNTTGSPSANDYTYDLNASVTASTTKSLTSLVYDKHYGLTTQIDRTAGGSTFNTYFHYGRGGRTYKLDQISTGVSWVKTAYIRGLHSYPVIEKTKNQAGTTSTTRYIYGPLGIIATQQDGSYYFHLRDHLGSTRIVLNNSGVVQSVYTYTPLGEVISSTVGEGNSYTFTGQEYDEETGLYNYRARMYDSDLGRFYGADPLSGTQPSWSPYHYAYNNPVTFTDPTGLCPNCRPSQWDVDGDGMTDGNYGYGPTPDGPTGGGYGASLASDGSYNWMAHYYSQISPWAQSPSADYNTYKYGLLQAARNGDMDAAREYAALNGDYLSIKGSKNVSISISRYGTSIHNLDDGTVLSIGYGEGISLTRRRVGRNVQNGGSGFSNSNLALDIGDGIYGAMAGLTTSQGYWLGENGRYYSTGWGGNQHTGSRANALKAANTYKLAGRATIITSVGIGIYSTRAGYQLDGGQFGYNAQLAAASSAGSIAFGVAGAEAGALIGAGIGAWFGGVGAIPGAVIGGVIGGFGLGVGGGYLGGYLGESAVNNYYGK